MYRIQYKPYCGRLFNLSEYEVLRAVGTFAVVLLPDFSMGTLEALNEFVTKGEVTLPSSSLLEFSELATLFEIAYIQEQVTI